MNHILPKRQIKLSAVIACYRDGPAIPIMHQRLTNVFKNLGVKYVIIGHSERRRLLGETDEMINKKVLASLADGLKVILCVGESAEVRQKGIEAAKKFIANQLEKDLLPASKPCALNPNIVIAYEPIWAIGTGTPDTPEDSSEMAKFIKKILTSKPYTLNPAVLYGGSVTSKTAGQFLEQKEIGGALVGGASFDPEEFGKIVEIAAKS